MRFVPILLACLLSACSYLLEINLYNGSASTITVETPRKSVQIKSGESARFYFSSNITLISGASSYKYEAGWGDLSDYTYGFLAKNKVNAQLDSNLVFYLVKLNQMFPVHKFNPQPEGFPKWPKAI